MISLEERYILKSFGYIRREWRNGRWRYWYDDIRGKIVEGKYGKVLKNFVGDPRQAFKALFRMKTGQAYDVVTLKLPAIDVDEKGHVYEVKQVGGHTMPIDTPIDLVWGNNKKGLKHILIRHFVQQNDFKSIQEAEDKITYNLLKLQRRSDLFDVKFNAGNSVYEIVNKEGDKFVVEVEVSKDIYGNQAVRHFILTSYDSSKPMNNKEIKDENIRSMHFTKINQTRY